MFDLRSIEAIRRREAKTLAISSPRVEFCHRLQEPSEHRHQLVCGGATLSPHRRQTLAQSVRRLALDSGFVARIAEEVSEGFFGILKVAKAVGVGTGTVARIAAEMRG